MKVTKKIDGVAIGLMTLGALNWGVASLTRRDAVGGAIVKRSLPPRLLYGAIGIAALHKLIRSIAPKTREEKRRQAFENTIAKIDNFAARLTAFTTESRRALEQGRKTVQRGRRDIGKMHSRLPLSSIGRS